MIIRLPNNDIVVIIYGASVQNRIIEKFIKYIGKYKMVQVWIH